jgi:hypothetical protein
MVFKWPVPLSGFDISHQYFFNGFLWTALRELGSGFSAYPLAQLPPSY